MTEYEANPKILVVDDVPANVSVLMESLEAEDMDLLVAPDGETAMRAVAKNPPDLILLDIVLPGIDGVEVCRRLKQDPTTAPIPIIFITARDDTKEIVDGFEAGGVDYVVKPFQTDVVLRRIKTHLRLYHLNLELRRKNQELETAIRRRQAAEAAYQQASRELNMLSEREIRRWGLDSFVGRSPMFQTIVERIRKVQPFERTNVLITGDSGAGKELIARAIHYGSPRNRRPFITVNCAAVTLELAESFFFGHQKGSFTGADADHKGVFREADGGTLFLDELGEMPLELQSKLLRVLESKTIKSVGAQREEPVDFRVIAGTNANLKECIDAKLFRQDLFFRLAQYQIDVPPLSERVEDIPLLANHFLSGFADAMGLPTPAISPEAMECLLDYDYPGNIRELKNILESALIESGGKDIHPEHLSFYRGQPPRPGATSTPDATAISADASPRHCGPDELKVLHYLEDHESITNVECRQLLNVGLQRASYLLKKLNRVGLVTKTNTTKSAQYRHARNQRYNG